MADEIQRVQYFYTEVSDKPGEGLKVLNALRDEESISQPLSPFLKGDGHNSISCPWINRLLGRQQRRLK